MAVDLNDPEVQAAISAANEESTKKLKEHNAKLVAELRAAKKGQEIDPDEHRRLQESLDRAQDDLVAAQKAHKDLTKQMEQAQKQLADEAKANHEMLVINGLQSALTASGVTNPAHLQATMAMLKSDAVIDVVDGKRVAKMAGKPLAEAVAEWAKGEVGKHFVAAPVNSGGGATGNKSGTPNNTTGIPAGKTAMTATEYRARIQNRNPLTAEEMQKIHIIDG